MTQQPRRQHQRCNISNGAVGSDGRGISASLNGVGAQGGLTGRATQSAGGVGGQAVVGRANGGASSIRVASGTAGSAGSQVGANTQDATLATSGGIVKMSVAPVMSNDSGLVRSTVDQAGHLAQPIQEIIGDGKLSEHMAYLNNPGNFMPSLLAQSSWRIF